MEEKAQSKRPDDTDFKQQRLPAWQPLLTPAWVISTFFIVGVVFLPIGIAIVVASNSVVEVTYRYDEACLPVDPNGTTACNVYLPIDEDMEGPVYFYYELTNYYQNHRRYVKSRSDPQLRGESGGTSSCTPLEKSGGLTLYPCGLIANSMFNDTFEAFPCTADGGCSGTALTGHNWDKRDIAWKSDREHKFKHHNFHDVTETAPDHHPLPDVEDQDFMVWMRTAGLPTFRKLYRKIARSFKKGEQLQVAILNRYPVSEFDGEKRVVLSTTSWAGGKNEFLGWSYIAVSIVCLLLGIAFYIKHSMSPRRPGDMQYFNWSGAGGGANAENVETNASS